MMTDIENWNILLIGNNPIELSHVFSHVEKLQGKKINTEIAFDLKSTLQRLMKFKPGFIVIDDNIGTEELKNSIDTLHKKRITRNVPITVLKNSNYMEAVNTGVMNYVLKQNLTGDTLYISLKNSLKFLKTQEYLRQSYLKRKGQIQRMLLLDQI